MLFNRKPPNFDADKLAAISRLFSSSVVRELGQKECSPLFAKLVSESGLLDFVSAEISVSQLFDVAFSVLKYRGNRHEYVYKAALTQKMFLAKHTFKTATLLSEFRVGDCKADLVVLNGRATAYEVKSERDSLKRLANQVEAYRTVFAEVYVIAGENHADAVSSNIPNDVGIMTLNSRHKISTLRDAVSQPERTSPEAIFESIRAVEAMRILQSIGIEIPVVPNTQLSAVLKKLFTKLDSTAAQKGLVQVLKDTRTLRPLSSLMNLLPRSLHAAALATQLRKSDHMRLATAVNHRLADAMSWV